MKAKQALTTMLLLFVAASLAAWGVRRFGHLPARRTASEEPNKVIAYYFHRTQRCGTCKAIEDYSREAIAGGFGEELRRGRLEWRPINYEEPRHRHFRDEFDLVAPSLVLVAVRDGRQTDSRQLPEVWSLVSDKEAFVQYVQSEVEAFLDRHARRGRGGVSGNIDG